MATDKEIIQQLFKIAQKQQKAINKLAQEAGLVPSNDAPPQSFSPSPHPTLREADVILQALPTNVKALIAQLEVHGSNVKVLFHPGKNSPAAVQAITNVVNGLQQSNALQFPHYNIVPV